MPHSSATSLPIPPDIRLPDFFVIGAMKAGTTTLYHDLRLQAGIELPDKESNALLCDEPAAAFFKLLRGIEADALFGEVCPDYSKPASGERAAAAAALLYRDRTPPKLIYLVREPIARLRSHHYFVSSQQGTANPGGMTADFEGSLQDFPELIETSRYATRLKPWIDAFGKENLHVVRFESYVSSRVETVGAIAAFLGLPGDSAEAILCDRVYNPSDSRPVATPGWHRFRQSPLYRKWIRPFFPLAVRDRIRSRILPKPPPPPAHPPRETLERLRDELLLEVQTLSEIANSSELLWDLDAAIAKVLAESDSIS